MNRYAMPPLWKQAPFIRLLIPLCSGITLQWYYPFSLPVLLISISTCLIGLWLFGRLPALLKYYYGFTGGLLLNLLITIAGCILLYFNQVSHQPAWLGNYYRSGQLLIATLKEPPLAKNKSYRVNCSIDLVSGNRLMPAKGDIILYLQKDEKAASLQYGDRIGFIAQLQPIKNSGNPGAFDYSRYCAFNNLFFQQYVTGDHWQLLEKRQGFSVKATLYQWQLYIVTTLKLYIHKAQEQGLAEALLLGYKNDLDKNLVQAYSNTGVVHVIAISGLHLGLIYWLLNMLVTPLFKSKRAVLPKALTLLSGLWIFTLLSGASPSVLRSALMFTCIVAGESLSKKISVYNSLAASAFLLLCYNPFWLWDIGFQLSYTAVLSIVVFMKPVYDLLYLRNKLLDALWKLAAVTLAAQVLTTPLTLYHFHQFPLLFLFTNLLAVPLSSIILLAEIGLILLSFSPSLAALTGSLTEQLISFLNSFVMYMNRYPFSVWDNLLLSPPQVVLFYTFVFLVFQGLLQKNKRLLKCALYPALVFFGLRTIDLIQKNARETLIVYNIPNQKAIDLFRQGAYQFMGGEMLQSDAALQHFYCKPARIQFRHTRKNERAYSSDRLSIGSVKLKMVNGPIMSSSDPDTEPADIVIISQNPPVSIKELAARFQCRQLVLDCSNSPFRIRQWEEECGRLGIKCHIVSSEGAFVLTDQDLPLRLAGKNSHPPNHSTEKYD